MCISMGIKSQANAMNASPPQIDASQVGAFCCKGSERRNERKNEQGRNQSRRVREDERVGIEMKCAEYVIEQHHHYFDKEQPQRDALERA